MFNRPRGTTHGSNASHNETDGFQTAPAPVPYRQLLALFIGSRLLLFITGALALALLPKGQYFNPPHGMADWFLRWDAQWYLDIIKNGYRNGGADTSNIGYFPLYPSIVWVLSLDGLIEPRLAGYVTSAIGMWLASVLLWRLVERDRNDPRLATLAVVFLLFQPVSVFFASLYSESWFLPLTIGCFLAARNRRWWLAGLLGALAAFTRYVGMALVVPLVWEWFAARSEVAAKPKRQGAESGAPPSARAERESTKDIASIPALFSCLLPLAGYGAYCALMWAKFGNPSMYAEANVDSGRHFTWFWGLFARPSFTGLPLFYQVWFAGSVLVAFGLLLGGVLLRMRTSYSIYVLTFASIYISARFVDSLPRYFAGLFPLYIATALLVSRWRKLTLPLVGACIGLQTLSTILFVNGYWFT